MKLFPLFVYPNARYTENIALVPGPVVKNNAILFREGGTEQSPASWEKRIDNGYPNVFYDDAYQEYRCYYTCFIQDESHSETPVAERPGSFYKESPQRVAGILLATSTDGVHWIRPDLGIVDYEGSRHNNILLTHVHGAGVFRDTHTNNPQQRYKMIVRNDGGGKMAVSFSPDGIHWCEPIDWPEYNPAGDTHNNAWWDEKRQKYVVITRTWQDSLRIASRCESDDFIHWSEPQEIYRGDGFDDQIYSMPVFQKDDLYLGLASFFHGGDRLADDFDCVDCELLYSADSVHWNRLSRGKPFIPRSPGRYGEDVADCACIYASRPVERSGKYELFYFGGNGQHTSFRETTLLCATIDPDMLMGYTPKSPNGGTLVTGRFRFTGDTIYVKADLTDHSHLQVSVTTLVPLHKPVEAPDGFSTDDAEIVDVGNHLYRITFPKGLSTLRNSPYALALHIDSGVLYGIGGDLAQG